MNREELLALAQDRPRAEAILRRAFSISAFYDEQWKAISAILRGQRILMIERTGFGKSLCYQFPAMLFDGITVIFSPLIALMRDQVGALNAMGIKARFINSEQTPEENATVISEALAGETKILYIAPERQENTGWIEATRQMRLSMVVVDEAHTISVWGHDFRPAFRRIVNLVRLLPLDMPVLAVTATATTRVQHDIEAQIGTGISTIRGRLMRENFRLQTVVVGSEEEKMVWLADNLGSMPGTGFIYTGTRVDADLYARWLRHCGFEAVGYHAGLDVATRLEIEAGLKTNRWKAIVSTNALGMGIDKPDLRFIIHTQIPASPIHYYQEIGRAGRDGKPTDIVLLYNQTRGADHMPEDARLPLAFINGAKPSGQLYQSVIDVLKDELLGEKSIVMRCNLKVTQFRVIKADLIEQGIIKEVRAGTQKKYEYQFNAPALNVEPFERLRQAKLQDLKAMIAYVFTKDSRMAFLCRFLGDEVAADEPAAASTLPAHITFTEAHRQRIEDFRQTLFPAIEVEERHNNIVNSVAASYYGVSTVGNAIHRSKYEDGGDFPDFLLTLTLRAYHKTFGPQKMDLVLSVPPTLSGPLVANFARKVASALRVPYADGLVKTRQTEKQKEFHSAYSKRDNVKDAFALSGVSVVGKRVLLIDDIYDSGATLREIGRLLTSAGATQIVPLVIAKTVGNDNIRL